MEYKEYRLSDIAYYKNEKTSIENINLKNYISTENMLPEKDGVQIANKLPETKSVKSYEVGDILISNIRPYFKKIWHAKYDGGASNDVLVINLIHDDIEINYLYYFLSQDSFFNYMNQTSKGTKMPRGDKKAIMDFKVKVPKSKIVQKRIADIGKNIDLKIENNIRIIANLEELSQTLFKHWFVDFEFPDENGNPYKSSGGEMVESELGDIPVGWKINTINDFANNNVITGKTPSTKIKENYSESGVPFLTIPDMHKDVFALNTERYISELGVEKMSKKILPKNSLAISCIATPGLVSITPNDILTNQQINSFTPNKNALYYLYFKLKGMKDYIRDLGSGGSATLNLNKTQFSKIKIVNPTNKLLYKYDNLVKYNFDIIFNLQKEIKKLTQLRDTLLPKLMSGEIEISDEVEVDEDEL